MTYPKKNVTAQLYTEESINNATTGNPAVPIATGITDINGEILFENVLSGKYHIKVISPSGYTLVEGHVENVIDDTNTADNAISVIDNYTFIANIDVSRDTQSTATIVLTHSINTSLVLTMTSNTSFTLQLISEVVAAETITVPLTVNVTHYDDTSPDFNMTFIIPQGSINSNVSSIDIHKDIYPTDTLGLYFGIFTPDGVVVNSSNAHF